MTLQTLLTKIHRLPYSTRDGKVLNAHGYLIASCSPARGRSPDAQERATTIYCAHAANILPELVKALEAMVEIICESDRDITVEDCDDAKRILTRANEIKV